jgi:diaminopimelate decarboxylase
MAGFTYRDDDLYCEEVDLAEVAQSAGTPCYIYGLDLLQEAYGRFQKALEPLPGMICYALKANPNLALCKILASMGCGADVVSGGELYRALKAGFPPHKIVFAGVGKTEEEIRFAINADIAQLNVESVPELELISRTAQKLEARARVALRINPDIRPETHPYVTTAVEDSKFGIGLEQAPAVLQHALSLPGLEITGLHFHLGSQIASPEPYREALKKIQPLLDEFRRKGLPLNHLDVGGGLAISYDGRPVPSPQEWLDAMREDLKGTRCTVIVEPGRALVGRCGALVTRVLYIKRRAKKSFAVVDAGMNDLLRPSLYGAFHQVWPLRRESGDRVPIDVVGPVCESADFLAPDRQMVLPHPGALLAVMNTGAYGAAMSSNYNGRPRAAEILVSGERFAVIRRRESYEDLLQHDVLPALVTKVCDAATGSSRTSSPS